MHAAEGQGGREEGACGCAYHFLLLLGGGQTGDRVAGPALLSRATLCPVGGVTRGVCRVNQSNQVNCIDQAGGVVLHTGCSRPVPGLQKSPRQKRVERLWQRSGQARVCSGVRRMKTVATGSGRGINSKQATRRAGTHPRHRASGLVLDIILVPAARSIGRRSVLLCGGERHTGPGDTSRRLGGGNGAPLPRAADDRGQKMPLRGF